MKLREEPFNKVTEEAQLRQYLLGQLSASARDALEDRFFEDPALLESLTLVEAELFDAAAAGSLSPAEANAWQAYLAANPERHNPRQRFAAALMHGVRPSPPQAPAGFSPRLYWLAAACATLALLFFVFLYPPRPASKPNSVTNATPVVFAFAVSPGTLRADAAPQVLRLPATATHLQLQFPSAPARASLTLRHIDSEALLWEGPATSPIPRTALRAGDCVATLRDASGQDLADASFALSFESEAPPPRKTE